MIEIKITNSAFGPWVTILRDGQEVFSWAAQEMAGNPVLAMEVMLKALEVA